MQSDVISFLNTQHFDSLYRLSDEYVNKAKKTLSLQRHRQRDVDHGAKRLDVPAVHLRSVRQRGEHQRADDGRHRRPQPLYLQWRDSDCSLTERGIKILRSVGHAA